MYILRNDPVPQMLPDLPIHPFKTLRNQVRHGQARLPDGHIPQG